jgi:GT2 family glycosyltransferase
MDELLILCCGTWKRYDLLNKLIASAENGVRTPDKIVIFDNGGTFDHPNPKVEIYRPEKNLGISAADNWFAKNIPGFKIVSNDDVELFPYTLETFWQYQDKGDLLVTAGLPILNAFTLFSVNQNVLDTVGYFDESISPGYAYFEDNDYGRRINLGGLKRTDVLTSSFHLGSGTVDVLEGEDKQNHHRKFNIAKSNYIAKWGGVPPKELWNLPYRNTGLLYVPYIEHKVERVK